MKIHERLWRTAPISLLGLWLLAGCQPGYMKASDLESRGQGPSACAKSCEDIGMRMAALVLVSNDLPGCVCQPLTVQGAPPAASAAPLAPAPVPAPPAPAAPAPPSTAPSTPSAPTSDLPTGGAAAATAGYAVLAAAAAARQAQLERRRQAQPINY